MKFMSIHTYTASLYPFIKKGAKPIWIDIDPDNMVINLDFIKKKLPKNKSYFSNSFIWFLY